MIDGSDVMLLAGQWSTDAGKRTASVSSEDIDVTELGFESVAASSEVAPPEVTSSCSGTLLSSGPTQAVAHPSGLHTHLACTPINGLATEHCARQTLGGLPQHLAAEFVLPHFPPSLTSFALSPGTALRPWRRRRQGRDTSAAAVGGGGRPRAGAAERGTDRLGGRPAVQRQARLDDVHSRPIIDSILPSDWSLETGRYDGVCHRRTVSSGYSRLASRLSCVTKTASVDRRNSCLSATHPFSAQHSRQPKCSMQYEPASLLETKRSSNQLLRRAFCEQVLNDDNAFLKAYHKQRENRDVEISAWRPGQGQGEVRVANFTSPVSVCCARHIHVVASLIANVV